MLVKGQVVKLDRGFPLVRTELGDLRCKHATALVKGHKLRAVIGDFVTVDTLEDANMAQIVDILPRSNELIRKDPAERVLPQVLAANFDLTIIAHPLAELNIRRLERELVLAHESGSAVAVALTKADLAADAQQLEASRSLVEDIVAEGVRVLCVSEHDPESIEAVRKLIPEGSIAVLIGQSGAGKSSLVNMLAGSKVMDTTPVRETDGKGRHTTVSRAMVQVQGGGLVVDMPGVRGLGLWESEKGIEAVFPDIARLAESCRFRDCKHENEPGCAVLKAVAEGRVPQVRLESYRNLMAENLEQRRRSQEAERIRERTGRHVPHSKGTRQGAKRR